MQYRFAIINVQCTTRAFSSPHLNTFVTLTLSVDSILFACLPDCLWGCDFI